MQLHFLYALLELLQDALPCLSHFRGSPLLISLSATYHETAEQGIASGCLTASLTLRIIYFQLLKSHADFTAHGRAAASGQLETNI